MGFYGTYSNMSIHKINDNPSVECEECKGTSTTAKINIGVCEGYNNTEEQVNDFASYLQIKLEDISKELGFYISFIVYEVKTVYKKEWGCPDGGEKTYNLEATRNPVFNPDDNLWKDQVLQVIRFLKDDLKQSTVTIQFIPIEIVYMKAKENK